MELSWHPEERIVILSLWNGTVCRASFRLPVGEVPGVIEMLAASQRTGRDADVVVHMSEHAGH